MNRGENRITAIIAIKECLLSIRSEGDKSKNRKRISAKKGLPLGKKCPFSI